MLPAFPVDIKKITAVRSQYKADDTKIHEEERDAAKTWRNHSFNLILFGIENQTHPDADMPLRVMAYDGANYRSQLLKGKRVRYPVVTIVLYFGKEPWNCPVSLKGCFNPELPDTEEYHILNKYINDYKCHVFDIPRLSDETVNQFRSDFRVVAEFFTNAYTNPGYEPKEQVIRHVDEFLKLMSVLTGDSQYWEMAKSEDFQEERKKGGITMCNVMDYREARGEAKGKAEIVFNMYNVKKMTAEEIAEMTLLSLEEVIELLKGKQ